MLKTLSLESQANSFIFSPNCFTLLSIIISLVCFNLGPFLKTLVQCSGISHNHSLMSCLFARQTLDQEEKGTCVQNSIQRRERPIQTQKRSEPTTLSMSFSKQGFFKLQCLLLFYSIYIFELKCVIYLMLLSIRKEEKAQTYTYRERCRIQDTNASLSISPNIVFSETKMATQIINSHMLP